MFVGVINTDAGYDIIDQTHAVIDTAQSWTDMMLKRKEYRTQGYENMPFEMYPEEYKAKAMPFGKWPQ